MLSPDHLASQGNLGGDGVRNGDGSDSDRDRASISSLSDVEGAWDKHDRQRPPLPACTVRTMENQAETTTCDIVIHPKSASTIAEPREPWGGSNGSSDSDDPGCDDESNSNGVVIDGQVRDIHYHSYMDKRRIVHHNYHVHHHHYHHHVHTHQKILRRPPCQSCCVGFNSVGRNDDDNNDDDGGDDGNGSMHLSDFTEDNDDYVGTKGNDGRTRVTILRSATVTPLGACLRRDYRLGTKDTSSRVNIKHQS